MAEPTEDLINRFQEADKSEFLDFSKCAKQLDMALWVLWVSKEKVGERRLTAEQIALVIRDTQEISAERSSIINSLNRASDKVHRYHVEGDVYFEIMRPGKEYLLSLEKSDIINAFYFKPDSRFTAKKFLRTNIFNSLTGNLRIVDPYCGERTLDILESVKDRHLKLLTRIENLRERERNKFVRELADFKSENPNMEFRNYHHSDIHDRYVISETELVLIGHSLKDLGTKETYAVILAGENYSDLYQALSENFNIRWENSNEI